MADKNFMKELMAFCREKGYIWGPSPEIYGGLAGFYTYGPLGKLLKNNIEDQLRKVFNKHDFWEVECPTIMPSTVWEASGHLEGFTDPLIQDEDGALFRADHIIEEWAEKNGQDPAKILSGKTKHEELLKIITKNKITAPNGKKLVPKIMAHNLMMKTTIGVCTEAYNRPETATTTYLPFPRYFDYFRKKLPFGVFQIGKAYRNEISPRQFTLRMREFTQAEAQLFIFADQKNNYKPYAKIKNKKLPLWYWKAQDSGEKPEKITLFEARKRGHLKNDAYAYALSMAYELFTSIGVPEERIRLRQHGPDEKAFYADDAWDIEVLLKSFGWTEMCGVHDRTDYDLKQHEKQSGKPLGVSDETHKKEIPHVLEVAFGTDRMTFVLLDNLYDPKEANEGKKTLKVPHHIAPIKTAVYPLVKKDGMPEEARKLYEELTNETTAIYDESGSIGRRYLRAAEMGIPYCITIDGETIKKGTVTIRDRDTEEQKRIKKEEVSRVLHELINGKRSFKEL